MTLAPTPTEIDMPRRLFLVLLGIGVLALAGRSQQPLPLPPAPAVMIDYPSNAESLPTGEKVFPSLKYANLPNPSKLYYEVWYPGGPPDNAKVYVEQSGSTWFMGGTGTFSPASFTPTVKCIHSMDLWAVDANGKTVASHSIWFNVK